MEQNLMNKTGERGVAVPLRRHSPDQHTSNRVAATPLPTKQIHKYLGAIRTQIRGNKQGALDSTSNQSFLRRRIVELEKENNQYRLCLLEYEDILLHNQHLEQQMGLLLQELQTQQPVELQTQRPVASLKTSIGTNTSAGSKKCESMGGCPVSLEMDQFRKESRNTQQICTLEIRKEIQSLEQRLMNCIYSLEEKISALSQRTSSAHSTARLPNEQQTPLKSHPQRSDQQLFTTWQTTSKKSSPPELELQFQQEVEQHNHIVLKKKKSSLFSLVNMNLEDRGDTITSQDCREELNYSSGSTPKDIMVSQTRQFILERVLQLLHKAGQAYSQFLGELGGEQPSPESECLLGKLLAEVSGLMVRFTVEGGMRVARDGSESRQNEELWKGYEEAKKKLSLIIQVVKAFNAQFGFLAE